MNSVIIRQKNFSRMATSKTDGGKWKEEAIGIELELPNGQILFLGFVKDDESEYESEMMSESMKEMELNFSKPIEYI